MPILIAGDAMARFWVGVMLLLAAVHLPFKEPGSVFPADDDPLPEGALRRLGSLGVWPGEVLAVAFSPDGKILASGGDEQKIHLWDVATGKKIKTLEGLPSPVLCLAFSPDGKLLASGGQGKLHQEEIGADKENPKSPILRTVEKEGGVFLWDWKEGKKIRQLDTRGEVQSLAFSSQGRQLATAGRQVKWWEVATGRDLFLPGRDKVKLDQTVLGVACSPDGNRLAVSTKWSGKVYLLDLAAADGKLLAKVGPSRWQGERRTPLLSFSSDGKYVAAADSDNLRFWELATGKEHQPFKTQSVVQAVFSPRDNRLAWIDYYGTRIYIADLGSGEWSKPLMGHMSSVRCLAFSLDGKMLASGSRDGTVLLWDAAGQKLLTPRQVQESLASSSSRDTIPVPHDAKVHLVFPKKKYLLGENIVAKFVVENTGKGLFHINLGGDYRLSSRHLRYRVTARDDQGKQVEDPDPSRYSMGGRSQSVEVLPGQKNEQELPLLPYCRFEKPGVYKIRASHDLGWHETKTRKHPLAEARITLVAPTPDQARKLVDGLYGEKKDESDFYYLRDPVYLPVLAARAEKGDDLALIGIGNIATVDATRLLLRLAEHGDEKFALAVLQELNKRLPDPELQGKLPTRNSLLNYNIESRRWLVERAWRAEMAEPVRAIAGKLMFKKDRTSLECAGYILQCVGQKEDVRLLIKGLDWAVPETAKVPADKTWEPRNACVELVRAAEMLDRQDAAVPLKPSSPGEAMLFLHALQTREKFRPRDWEETAAMLLQDEIPFMRETALSSLPTPLPGPLFGLVRGLLDDANQEVRTAACERAGASKDPRFQRPLLDILKTTKHEGPFHAAENALYQLGVRLPTIEVLVSRLDEPGITDRCLRSLAGWVIADLGSFFNTSDPPDAGQSKKLKARWQKFLRDHGPILDKRAGFKLGDPALTPDLFPHLEFRSRSRMSPGTGLLEARPDWRGRRAISRGWGLVKSGGHSQRRASFCGASSRTMAIAELF